MAIYSTFFLCSEDELKAFFPEMRPALEEAVEILITDPSTGEKVKVLTREPEWDDLDTELPPPDVQVVAGHGDYQEYLESRLPGSLKQIPHWPSKNLTPLELDPLVKAVLGDESAELKPALFSPPSQGRFVSEFPVTFTRVLSIAEDDRVSEFAIEWSSTMSSHEFTHSIAGERIYEDWTIEDALVVINPILELVKKLNQGQRMYLLVEF